MDIVIALAVSVIGTSLCSVDFGTLYAFVSAAMSLYKSWIDYANDETARR